MPVKGGYLLAAGGGVVLLWSGVKGHKWSTVLKDVVSGQSVGQPDQTITTSQAAFGYGTAGTAAAKAALLPGATGGTVAKNQAIAKVLAAPYGWSTGAQWAALDWIWNAESSWDNKAHNPSGAYGIPQALPASKMGAAANPPLSSATAQIAWGLKYIKQTYGDPIKAKVFHLANGWY